MTPEELRAIRERCEAATPGPWSGTANSGVVTGDGEATVFETGCGCCTESTLTEADAAFIAASRTDVPALLDEVESLRTELERTRQACGAWAADMRRAGFLCEQGGNEYPLQAVERFVQSKTATSAMLTEHLREARAEAKELREVLTRAVERFKACSYELTEFSYQEMASVLFDLPCNTEEPTNG